MNTVRLDPATTALVLIDLQQGIVAMEGAPHSTRQVVQQCAELARKFRKAGAGVVYVRVDVANFVKLDVDRPSRDPNAPPPPAAAMELMPEAGKEEQDLLITKRHWSALIGTELEWELRSRGVQTIVLGGVATNFGVESTARDAAGLGFDVVFVEEAMTSVSVEAHRFAVDLVFPRIGRVRSAAELELARA
jgi:nicotinamidase-related amidase